MPRLFINTRATCKWVLLLSLFTNKAEAQRALSSGLGGGVQVGLSSRAMMGTQMFSLHLELSPLNSREFH